MSEERLRGGPGHGLTWEEYHAKYGKRITELEGKVRILNREIENLTPDAIAGKHFKQLMRAVNENPLVQKEWGRFMMTLRMAGLDSSNYDQ